MRKLADLLWSLGLRRWSARLHLAAALRRAPCYVLLCVECTSLRTGTFHRCGVCQKCGRYRALLAERS